MVDFDGLSVAFLPWINKENYDESMKFIETVSSPILVGHLELNGYQVMRGMKFSGGLDAKIFQRFEQVLSGHFHTKSQKLIYRFHLVKVYQQHGRQLPPFPPRK